jgi:hypothetical protein
MGLALLILHPELKHLLIQILYKQSFIVSALLVWHGFQNFSSTFTALRKVGKFQK